MAKRFIVTVPDPILLKQCRPVEKFDGRLAELLDDMKETLIDANGAGLAAPQVAVLRQIAVILTDDGYFELINPIVKKTSGEQTGPEGCLSLPHKFGTVTRPDTVTVSAFDRDGKLKKYTVKDFTARAFMHEIDHLRGVLYTDYCTDLTEE